CSAMRRATAGAREHGNIEGHWMRYALSAGYACGPRCSVLTVIHQRLRFVKRGEGFWREVGNLVDSTLSQLLEPRWVLQQCAELAAFQPCEQPIQRSGLGALARKRIRRRHRTGRRRRRLSQLHGSVGHKINGEGRRLLDAFELGHHWPAWLSNAGY